MSRPILELYSREGESGDIRLECPGPGRVKWARRVGEVLVGGSVVGVLVRCERSYDLVTPAGIRGQVSSILVANPWNDCEHASALASLAEVATDATLDASPGGDGDESGFVLRSSTHGTFYRRPSPDAPNYVEVGQSLEEGVTVGLDEVMKCFSPISFSPPAGASGATLEEVLVEDGAEVRTDQPLFRIRLT